MIQTNSIAVVDLQGFTSNNEYILKEIYFSIFNYNGEDDIGTIEHNIDQHFIFKPPFAWNELDKGSKANAIWLLKFYHGFWWNDGQEDYSEIANYMKPLLRNNLIIFVKGFQKVQWLKDLCPNNPHLDVRNIEDLGCNIRLSDESYNLNNSLHCSKHCKIRICARQNVEILKNWLRLHPQTKEDIINNEPI